MYVMATKTNEDFEEVKIVYIEDTLIKQTSNTRTIEGKIYLLPIVIKGWKN